MNFKMKRYAELRSCEQLRARTQSMTPEHKNEQGFFVFSENRSSCEHSLTSHLRASDLHALISSSNTQDGKNMFK